MAGTIKRKTNKDKKENTNNLRKKSVNTAISKIRSKSSVLVSKTSSKRKNKRINYSPESLQNAIKALDTGISLRKAANAYGVPVATLARRKNTPDATKLKTGPPTVLTETEESEIVNWILYRAERGYPVNKTELLDCIQKYIQSLKKETPFIDDRPGRHWYEGFRKRHQNLSIRTVQHLSLSRAAVTRQDLKEWFNEQKIYLNSKDLLDIPPNRIFNCDETSISLCPDSDKVLTKKGCCSTYKITDAGKENLTVLFMYSAAGTRGPPMLMFPYNENIPKKIIENTPKGWGIGISESGWMTTETFYEYITNVFYPWLVKENIQFPVILYLDNHTSHITIPVVSFCRDKKIEIIGLYPNSTHILQPLDIAFFHPFKQMWRKSVPKWKIQNNVMQVKRADFPLVLKMALDNLNDEKSIIQSGFKSSGLMPFNPDAVDYDILKKSKESKSTSTHKDQLQNHQISSDNVMENKNQHLETFEKNISPDQLLEFKNANGQWTGNIEKKALFEYWFQIGGTSFDRSLSTKPTIKSVENLIDFKIKVVSQETANENREDNSILPINNKIFDNDAQNIIPDTSVNVKNEPVLKVIHVSESSHQENVALQFVDETVVLLNDTELNDAFMSDIPVNIINSSPEKSKALINQEAKQIVVDKENTEVIHNQDNSNIRNENFANAFTLPTQYLPRKKKIKIETSNKSKLPSAGTSDAWWQQQLEKEKQQQIKEEKISKKKKLQEEKMKLANERKKLQEKIKEIQQKIKEETK